MPIPMAVARLNRYLTNPIARLVAGWAPGFCILRHVGRRSGRVYSTPLNIFRAKDGFVIALTYGPDTDWLKNVRAAGNCTIRYGNQEIDLVEPEFLATEAAMAYVPPPVRVILRLIAVTEFLHLKDVT
jgi:deazaflavin-dependent oxidoreductase (nitroreductase family)